MRHRSEAGLGLPRSQRLRAREVQPIFQQRGRRVERRTLVAIWQPREGMGRVGFAVGRRLAGAVERNRGRRRLREAYRRGAMRAVNFDVVFVARPALFTATFSQLVDDVEQAMHALSARAPSAGGGHGRAAAR